MLQISFTFILPLFPKLLEFYRNVETQSSQTLLSQIFSGLNAYKNSFSKPINDRYDIVTIAAVANDVPTLELSLELGCRATNVTSRYDGTALIAAAHLGHVDVVRTLVRARAPLDHVNNLGWTAVIESIVLGDGGPRHTEVLSILVEAKANPNLPDRSGRTPLALARERGYRAMAKLLEDAGAR